MSDISTVWNATRGDWVLDPLVVGYETITLPTAVQFATGDGVSASFPLVTARFAGFVGTPAIYKNAGDWRGNELQYFTPRTNYLRNNTMVGAVVGTSTLPDFWGVALAGLSCQVVGLPVVSGIQCIDLRLFGNTTGTTAGIRMETNTQIAAAAGQTWDGSAYLAMVGGSVANITGLRLNLQGYQAGGSSSADNLNGPGFRDVLGATLARFDVSATLADVATKYVRSQVLLSFSAGAAIDITLRIGLPQLERSAAATPVIPTSGSAVTVTDCTLSNGLVTFASAPPLGSVLTWRGSYSASKVSGSGGLLAGGDIASAVLISLFTDRVANADDEIPDGSGDPRGWWGDAGEKSPVGSRLWLLEREKQTDSVLQRAQDYAKEALQWMIDDSVVARFTITTEWTRAGMLGMDVIAFKPDGTAIPMRFESAWTFANN